MQGTQQSVWLNIGAIMLSLVVVHILGRFIFTPLIPYFIQDGLFTVAQATDLASINYLGYLIGAWLAIFSAKPTYLKKVLLIHLVLNIATTIGQCFTIDFTTIFVLRLINGISNGVVFVLAPALMLEWLHTQNKAHLSGLVYFGVSAGLVLSGFLVSKTADFFVLAERWIPAAVLSVVLGVFALYRIQAISVDFEPQNPNTQSPPLLNKNSALLFLAYFGAGFGYILPMTFLPTLAYQINKNEPYNVHLWTLAALACLCTTSLWNTLGAKWGDKFAIILSYVVQALGIVALFVLPGIWGLIGCALGVGGGFLGSVMCTQRYARALNPSQGIRLSAALITVYAVAQLAAPMLTKILMGMGMQLFTAFWMGLIAFVWSIVAMCAIRQ